MKTPKEIIGELAGYASLCWQPRPTGVFDSTEASKAVDQALQFLAQIEESKRLTELDYEQLLDVYVSQKYNIYTFNNKEIAHAIYEAQRAKNERGKR